MSPATGILFKLSSVLFFVLSSVVCTISIVAEPCLPKGSDNANGGFAKYDQPACDFCAHSGKGRGQCCDAIYKHSSGRDTNDDLFHGDVDSVSNCVDIAGEECAVGEGWCYPGLVCVKGSGDNGGDCKLPTDNPEAHAASSLLTLRSSTSNATKSGHSFVLVVVSLIGAAMMALKVVQRRHRGLLHRNQYNEVDV